MAFILNENLIKSQKLQANSIYVYMWTITIAYKSKENMSKILSKRAPEMAA